MPSNPGSRALALLAAVMVVFAAVATVVVAVAAATIHRDVSGNAVTLSGTWTWPSRVECEDRVGWAVDWDDPSERGNSIGEGISVGKRDDNEVHTNPDCGSASAEGHQGRWSAISRTHPGSGDDRVGVVLYEVDKHPSHEEGTGPTPSDGSSPGTPGTPGASGQPATIGTGPTPTGSVQGTVSGGGGASAQPGEGYIVNFQQQTPSGIVMILILLLGVAASVVIMTLSKRTNGTP